MSIGVEVMEDYVLDMYDGSLRNPYEHCACGVWHAVIPPFPTVSHLHPSGEELTVLLQRARAV